MSMRKGTILLAVTLGWTMLYVAGAYAQETAPKAATQPETEGKNKSQSWDKPLEEYHLDFSINEIEDGKKINSRQYLSLIHI